MTRFWRQKRTTNLRLDHIRPPVNVRSSEAKQAEPCVDQQILTTIVFDKAVTMVAAVVLEHEPRGRVVEVGSTHEPTIAIMQLGLNLRPRQPALNEQPSEPGLHR
jgi:hypothetical protein